jgi:hypothetical protein
MIWLKSKQGQPFEADERSTGGGQPYQTQNGTEPVHRGVTPVLLYSPDCSEGKPSQSCIDNSSEEKHHVSCRFQVCAVEPSRGRPTEDITQRCIFLSGGSFPLWGESDSPLSPACEERRRGEEREEEERGAR